MEVYKGVKFEVVFISSSPPEDERIAELKEWCLTFHKLGLSPAYNGSCGNLSFRRNNSFIITPSGVNFGKIREDDFVEVKKCDLAKKIVYVIGKNKPSSESMLHYAIYEKRSEINAIFHGHSREILEHGEELGVVTAREVPYGSVELLEEVLKILGKNNFIILKNHGFLSLGRSMEEAGEIALEKLRSIMDK